MTPHAPTKAFARVADFQRLPLWILLSFVCLQWSTIDVQAEEQAAHLKKLHYFESHIRPLLHSRCVKCHGESLQKGELRLDSLEAMLHGGESGPAAVPGKPDESLLLDAVKYQSFEMPPDKPLAPEEISHLQTWIADGAVWPQLDGNSVRLTGATFSNDDRNFWSLQPISHPTPPASNSLWGNNSVDRFVVAQLDAANIQPAEAANAGTLVRRLYFDVLGVPPSPQEVEEFIVSANSRNSEEVNTQPTSAPATAFNQAYSQLVEKLLADPRYGEHWGRYWLDVVRYAESDGFRADTYRPDAWRYRDYVVDAFNDDKPYDQFVKEQLAGDEIAPDTAEALVATGYLRTYLYEYNQRDARTQWQDILNQVTDVTGEVFLGLGVGCARCHDHKFDPILQEDYYRLQACFGTMIPRDDVPAADLIDRQRYSQEYEAWLAKAADLRRQLRDIREPYMQKAAKGAIERFPEDIQLVMAKPVAERTPLDAQLADLVNRQVVFDQEREKIKDEDETRIEELEKQIAELAGNEPAKLPVAMTVADLARTPQTIHLAANPNRKVVSAGGFSILDASPFDVQPTPNSTGQRTALAEWITSPKNPLTARVIVNRVWQRHFGRGLVETASDFGSLGGRPTHPELLDWLASELIAHNWSIKWLHRQILNSATWQMSSFHPDAANVEKVDPANKLRWRYTVRRLNAEQIRDAMLTVSSELQSEQGGPSVAHTSLRRSLYLKVLRNEPEPLLRSLDGVDGLNSIPRRSTTTTPTQALNLMNGEWARQRSTSMARRVLDEAAAVESPADNYNLATVANIGFQIALGRSADAEEISIAVRLVNESIKLNETTKTDSFGSLTESAGTSLKISDKSPAPVATVGSTLNTTAPLTVVSMFKLDSLYPDATVRTLISQWDSNNANRGWAIGVTSEKSAFKPRNFILQVVTDSGYEVVASNLRPELNQVYMTAVTFDQLDSGKAIAKFYLKPLNVQYGKLETVKVEFKTTAGMANQFPVTIGGRTNQTRHRWDGQVDQLAIFNKALSADSIEQLFAEVLSSASISATSPTAFWNFDAAELPLADTTSNQHNLHSTEEAAADPLEQAVAELCQVLLNCNEFVYID